jgi:hypothetical protein
VAELDDKCRDEQRKVVAHNTLGENAHPECGSIQLQVQAAFVAAITLVCTSHSERGASTEDALLGILHKLEPEVVFLEVRASDLAALATRMLEARAVQRYSKFRQVEAVAVDEFEMPASFRSDMDSVLDYVEQTGDEFNALVKQRDGTALLGFEAMNSSDFEAIVEKCERSMELSIALSRNRELVSRHAAWTSLLRQREDSMLSNIYRFCRSRPHVRGAFLVGAAHLTALTKEIEVRVAREPEAVQWEVWSRPGRFSL